MYKEIEGDLIALGEDGQFDVIAHGCNCFCTQKKGIAKSMAEAFGTDKFDWEDSWRKGDFSKLGNIITKQMPNGLWVVNAYTQYNYGPNSIDYDALALCMRKIAHFFDKDKYKIGLPMIGAGLAGGDWGVIQTILADEFVNHDLTVVIYKP